MDDFFYIDDITLSVMWVVYCIYAGNWANVSKPHTSVFNLEFCLYVRPSVRSVAYRLRIQYNVKKCFIPHAYRYIVTPRAYTAVLTTIMIPQTVRQ